MIGEAVKKLRKKHKITQGDLCEAIDKTQSYMSMIENNQYTPSIPTIKKIAKVFKIPFQILLWYSLDEKQIPKEKREYFKVWKPSIDEFIENTFK